MGGFVRDAESLFVDFSDKHNLVIEKTVQNNIELLMTVSRQKGLSFDLTLGLQNDDEINIGFCDFWSYFFPFKEQRIFVAALLDDLAVGNARLAVYKQFGRVVHRDLEQITAGNWKRVYREHCKMRIPLIGTEVSYVVNEQVLAK